MPQNYRVYQAKIYTFKDAAVAFIGLLSLNILLVDIQCPPICYAVLPMIWTGGRYFHLSWLAPVYSKWQLLSVCCCKSVCFGKISDVAWEKMHFTWFSRRDGFSPTRQQILISPLCGSGQDTVSSWEKTPSLLENHVKCISSLPFRDTSE